MAIPAYYSLLQRGSSGPDVALVQTWLNGVRDACTWYSELKADGKFGISTENAVKEFASLKSEHLLPRFFADHAVGGKAAAALEPLHSRCRCCAEPAVGVQPFTQ